MKADPVNEHYSKVAVTESDPELRRHVALEAGYTEEDLALIPPEASLGLGCGNSVHAAALQPGEKVVDIGCGAGMDVFLAGGRVGPTGLAVGVDFSVEMIKKGTELAKKYAKTNVEFYNCSADAMPFPSNTFNVIISNCVLNLVPDKQKAFQEIYRVLKPGGRFVVSDIVLKKPLPPDLASDLGAIVGCVGRAVEAESYKTSLEGVGFKNVSVEDKKKDLESMFTKYERTVNICACCTSCCPAATALSKYKINEYAMSCTVTAYKL